MSRRRILLDRSAGEVRGVVLLDGLPERLLIERAEEPPRARRGERRLGRFQGLTGHMAFVDLGVGPPAALPRLPDRRPTQGALLEVEVVAEARGDKGPTVRLIGAGTGAVGLVQSTLSLEDQLAIFVPDAEIEVGPAAREAADLAEEAALAVDHAVGQGVTLAVEPTRACTAIDIDLAPAAAADPKSANILAVRHAVRLLRLKGLGGLALIDLVGFPREPEPIRRAAVAALAADGTGAAVGKVSPFGTLEITRPHAETPILERLAGQGALTLALRLLRALESAALADRAARLEGRCDPAVAALAAPRLSELTARFGARLCLSTPPSWPEGRIEVAPR